MKNRRKKRCKRAASLSQLGTGGWGKPEQDRMIAGWLPDFKVSRAKRVQAIFGGQS